MPKGYHHLTYEERCQVYALKQSGLSQSSIARQLGVDRRSIGRELNRNTGERGYRYKQADEKARTRRHAASSRPRKMTAATVKTIEAKLREEQWSPRQISGWLKANGSVHVSPERIYRKRCSAAVLPDLFWLCSIFESTSFELTLWSTLKTTRRVGSAGLRY